MTLNVNFDEVFENVMMNAVIAACDGNGVLDGLTVSEKGTGADMSVDVAAGNCMIDGVKSTETGVSNVNISAADDTYDRKDLLVYYGGTGGPGMAMAIAGTPGDPPIPPDITVPADMILLAIIDVGANVTQITNADITDCRVDVFGGRVVADTITEKTANAGVTIDGSLIKDGDIKVDTITEKTANAGVTIDGSLIKDGDIKVDTITEKTANAGVTIDGSLIKDGDIKVDTITEKTANAGVTIDGVSLKDGALILNDADELTIDSDGAITVTQSYHFVDTYGDAATDDLTTISNGSRGQILILQAANSARTVVVKHSTSIYMDGGVDFSLDTARDTIVLLYTIYGWVELSRSNNTS